MKYWRNVSSSCLSEISSAFTPLAFHRNANFDQEYSNFFMPLQAPITNSWHSFVFNRHSSVTLDRNARNHIKDKEKWKQSSLWSATAMEWSVADGRRVKDQKVLNETKHFLIFKIKLSARPKTIWERKRGEEKRAPPASYKVSSTESEPPPWGVQGTPEWRGESVSGRVVRRSSLK